MNNKEIVSKVLGKKVMLSSDSIAKATGCLHEGSTYQERSKKKYDSYVARALYKENAEKTGDQKTIVYNLMCERAKIQANILNKSVLHKVGLKTYLLDLHQFFCSPT